ncbi:zinc finger protein 431-like [Drosophila montana]|uniref:zinc finger protein 431-like n=1 Tax=Drosophila montana TaxID=40370 RepID=UPI00313D0E84
MSRLKQPVVKSMDQICRICLSGSASLMEIFGEREQSEDEPSLADILNECADCRVKSDDTFPKMICLPCTADAQTAFKFKRRCEHSYKLLSLKVEKRAVEVDVDAFCDMLAAEEWDLPKRVLDIDCIKVEHEESPQRENCKPTNEDLEQMESMNAENSLESYVEPGEHSKGYIERDEPESIGGSLEEDKSLLNRDLADTPSSTGRYPIRQSKRKSYIERSQISQSDTSYHSDWSEEPKTDTSSGKKESHFHGKKQQAARKQLHSEERQYKCLECPKEFSRHKTLQAHRRTHTGERPYKCPHCPKAFAQSHHARDHIQLHYGQRPHKCPHCPKAFTQKSNLRAHVHIHSAEGPHKCVRCSKSFVRNYDLTVHLRVHTGDHPYKCSHCSRAFNRRRDLDRHVRVHTGEQPYKCHECTARFSRSDQLKIHLANHVNGGDLQPKRRGRPSKKIVKDEK